MPGLAMSSGLDAGHLSHDQTVVNSYQADPLVHDRVTARWYTEFTEAGEECLRRAHELTMPLLIIHGQGDKIVDWRGSETVMNTASSADKEFHLFDGLFHETMNEAAEQRIQVLECIGSWIDRILKY
jgi:alpha-beta hydrolase superfamily lysophospholipase